MTDTAKAAVEDVRRRISALDPDSLDLILREARTHNEWQDRDVPDDLLRQVYDLYKWGATSMNCSPARVVFIRSPDARAKLEPLLMEGNRKKTMAAPVCALIGTDTRFFEKLPVLFPHSKGAADMFRKNTSLAEVTAFRNGTLQGAYLMIAARAVGLDCGPMSGFDNEAVDKAFFAGTDIISNFLCNLGYGEPEVLFDRSPRPAFDEVCSII
ncbi:MAG: malonic semialdehyde reductase [Rhodospirillales bacterium]